jgi:hypothetical protein
MVHINNTTQPNPYMTQLLTKCMTSVEDAITKEFKWARSIAQWQKKNTIATVLQLDYNY